MAHGTCVVATYLPGAGTFIRTQLLSRKDAIETLSLSEAAINGGLLDLEQR